MPKPNSTPYPQSDRELIRLIERSPSHRAGYKQLIRELGLGGGRERRLLLEQLTRITLRGDLIRLETGHWALPHATPAKTARIRDFGPAPNQAEPTQRLTRDNLVAGKLDLHRDGFGFVRPNGGQREDDLFISPNDLNGAMQGDEVLVDEAPPGRPGPDGKPRRSGRVVRILTRRNPTVVGIFHYAKPHGRRDGDAQPYSTAKFNFVTPLDERMTQPILIPGGPGGQPILPPSQTEHRTLGEEARRTSPTFDPSLPNPLEGLAVDVEITDFPTLARPAQGRLLEILGHPDDFGVDVEIVIRKHRLPYAFPANVLAEAADSATLPLMSDLGAPGLDSETWALRHDFRGLPIVTIDGETARDFDDAVHVQLLPNGHWQLQVHIADVSHYVQPASALDLEARLRGTSVYFPDRAVPMLPPALSSGMCSLRPDEDRLVLSCLAEIDPQGEVVDFQLCEGIIRSAARLTYNAVQAILDQKPLAEIPTAQVVHAASFRDFWPEITPAIRQMHTLALLLNRKRVRRGSIDFDLPEPVISFDPQGNMATITRSERGWANRLIEEFMLTANECVAHWLEALGPSLFRIHELPDPRRILDFEETAATYGQTLGFSSLPVKRLTLKSDRRTQRSTQERRGSSRPAQQHEVPESIPVTPQMYQRLTARIAGTPEERILSFLMLRSLKQARYSEKNDGHFALAAPSYTHFTSPIRRYPDLIVHRLLRAALRAGANPYGPAILSTDPQPWSSKRLVPAARPHPPKPGEPSPPSPAPVLLPLPELAAIALESSQAERRADDAERELMEWKKIKFMQDRVGEDFHATILSCTRYGFFVELNDLFIEGLVPIQTLAQSLSFRDHEDFTFRDTDRAIVGRRSGRVFRLGQRVHVLLDRIDRPARRLQFALLPPTLDELTQQEARAPRKPKSSPSTPSPPTSGPRPPHASADPSPSPNPDGTKIWQKYKARSQARKQAQAVSPKSPAKRPKKSNRR